MSFQGWLFSIGAFFMLVFFIVGSKKHGYIWVVLSLIFVGVPTFLPRQIFGSWNAIKFLKGKQVVSILFEPSQPDYDVNLSDSLVNISDTIQIKHILNLLTDTQIGYPSKPFTVWETRMIFVTKDNDSLAIKIKKTEDDGTIITSPPRKEFRKDELAEYLEKITHFTKPVKSKTR